ncbi:hypothetical protein BpHYR1_053814 [Brachionus plicatilis]|uniref:Uncharacterized protein n=1 Tax=Brachionus plicatilis TaxID=10195 RepID=A0A3M7QDA9_BRAPC|nr:hypothetical protein BpHYR1_053814 [Brachionus plicatilis]
MNGRTALVPLRIVKNRKLNVFLLNSSTLSFPTGKVEEELRKRNEKNKKNLIIKEKTAKYISVDFFAQNFPPNISLTKINLSKNIHFSRKQYFLNFCLCDIDHK